MEAGLMIREFEKFTNFINNPFIICLFLIIILYNFLSSCYQFYTSYLKKNKEEKLRILLIRNIPYRVVINNILIYINFHFFDSRILKQLYGRFLMDKSNKIFLIWKSCKIHDVNFIPRKAENLYFRFVKNIKLPKSIKKLYVESNTDIDTKFNHLFIRKDLINLTVISLTCCDYFINGNDLPKGLKKLKVDSCINFKFNNLPESIIKLVVIDHINFIDNNLTKNLIYLQVSFCDNFYGNNLPKTLTTLDVSGCDNFIGNNLPKNLEILRVLCCKNFIGNNLPKSLTTLDVSGCNNFIGNNLPKNFEISEVSFFNRNIMVEYSVEK